MNQVIIGIDPGVQGGFAAISGSELQVVKRCPRVKMKGKWEYDTNEMARLIKELLPLNPIMYLEKVSSRPGQGVVSTFNFGKGFGMWIGIAAAHQIPYELVTPQTWKKIVLEGTDKSKGAAILRAKQAFPHVDLKPGRLVSDHDGMAEAICIALYGGLKTWR